MKRKFLLMAASALLGLGLFGGASLTSGTAFAQVDGEYGDPPDLLQPNWSLPPERRIYRVPRRAPGPHGPAWRHPGWYGPGVGVYVAPPAPRYRPRYHTRRISDPHVEWCYAQYRSYREWDNTWQPLRGPRRECISPYY
jgi:hypothetical protein